MSKAMRVTVTGGAGFLGQYVVEMFAKRGYDVFTVRHRDFDLTRESDDTSLGAIRNSINALRTRAKVAATAIFVTRVPAGYRFGRLRGD